MSLSIIDKRFTSATISAGGTNGSTSLTLSATPTGLQPNQQIWLNGGSNSEDNFVAATYTPGSTSVPLIQPIANGTQTQIFFDGHNVNGPQEGSMLPFEVYPEIPVMYDRQQNAYVQLQGINGILSVTRGGNKSVAIAAGTATDTVIKGSPGRLASILVTTVGANAPQVFDNASAGSGLVIATTISSAPLGLIAFDVPALNGITVKGSASNPGMTIFYT